MSRPVKCRRVCCLPRTQLFRPDGESNGEMILTVDEYETLRLIDKLGFSQEDCGKYMDIARTTVQQIYTAARKKIATALVDGMTLRIEGGLYTLCERRHRFCGCAGCEKHRIFEGERKMKIAIPVDEDKKSVCISFGRTPFFMFVDSETMEYEVLANPAAEAEGGAGLKAAQFVIDNNADVLITVRAGQNAGDVFMAANTEIYKSSAADALENVKLYKEKKLEVLTHFHAGFHGAR